MRPLTDHFTDKFKEVYVPHKEVAIDEAIIKFTGRSSLKQYLPMKPIKRGIKVWVLGDRSNRYFWNFLARVVKELTSDIKGKYHHAFFDNYFTSVNLLEKDDIYSCGTAKDRIGFPEALKKPSLPDRCVCVCVHACVCVCVYTIKAISHKITPLYRDCLVACEIGKCTCELALSLETNA